MAISANQMLYDMTRNSLVVGTREEAAAVVLCVSLRSWNFDEAYTRTPAFSRKQAGGNSPLTGRTRFTIFSMAALAAADAESGTPLSSALLLDVLSDFRDDGFFFVVVRRDGW